MNTKIEYRDSLGNILTGQLKNDLWSYFKLTYDLNTNKLKTKVEYFGDSIINEGIYYMDSSENINEINYFRQK